MGSDVQSVQAFVIELVLLAAGSVAYAWLLLAFARHRGERFFLPGLAAGALGFLILFVGLQYARAAGAGVATRTSDVTRAALWMGPAGVVGSWFAARSVLKRLRARRDVATGSRAILRTVAAFMGGVALIVVVQLAALVALPPVARTPQPAVEPPPPPAQPQKTPSR
jgi:hypothetical protein